MKIAKIVFLAGLLAFGLACGYSKPGTMPVQPGTVPTITQLNPNNSAAGASFQLIVTGTGFGGNATVNFNGAQTPTAVTSTQITVTIPASAVMTSGTVAVSVTNPGTPGGPYGGGTQAETSTPMNFTIN